METPKLETKKAVPAKVEPKPVRWKLYKGQRILIPGLFEVSNDNLNNPSVIASIAMHEARTGHQLFGKVFVKA